MQLCMVNQWARTVEDKEWTDSPDCLLHADKRQNSVSLDGPGHRIVSSCLELCPISLNVTLKTDMDIRVLPNINEDYYNHNTRMILYHY